MSMNEVEVLRAACCVAGLDGEITAEERPYLNALAARVGVGEASLKAMMDMAVEDRNFYEKQLRFLEKSPDAVMKTLLMVAVADGELATAERVILQHFAERIGVPEERYLKLVEAAGG